MHTRAWIVVLTFMLLSLEGLAHAENWLQGQVLESHGGTKRPAAGAQVWIVNVGNPYTTSSDGGYRVLVPDAIRIGQTIVLYVKRKGWAIDTPEGGEVTLPPGLTANIVLFPEASPEFLAPNQLGKLFQSLPEKTKNQITPDGKTGEVDTAKVVADYATEHGLSAQEVTAKVEELAKQYQQSADMAQRCLAAIYYKNLEKAATLCRDGAMAKTNLLKRKRQEVEALSRSNLRSEYPGQKTLPHDAALRVSLPSKQGRIFQPTSPSAGGHNGTGGTWEPVVANMPEPKTAPTQLEEARRQLIQLTEEVVGDLLASGDVHCANYQFSEGLAAYQQGLTYVSKDELPTLWARVQWDIGRANGEIGIRTKESAIHHHLEEAVKAYHEAQSVFTRDDFPAAWADLQNNLGTVLGDQGTRTDGDAGTRLLAEAVAAYRAALTVRTKEQLPQAWAATQNNLAEALLHFEDWRGSAEAYRNVLTLYPDYDKGYSSAVALYQEKLFAYPEAFALSRHWLERHPNDLDAQANFAEAHFTTGRFAEAETRITALLRNPTLRPGIGFALRTLHVVTLLAANKPEAVPSTLSAFREFVGSLPRDFDASWSFEGSKHFIQNEPRLALVRAWMLDLFAAVEIKDAQERLVALEKVQSDFPTVNKPR